MRKQLLIAGAITAAILGGSGVAYATVSSPAATQPVNAGVYACVNTKGGIDYLEFNAPIPHPCWFPGETLWQLNAGERPTATRTINVTNTTQAVPVTTTASSPQTITLVVPAGSHLYGTPTATFTAGNGTVSVSNVNHSAGTILLTYTVTTPGTITVSYSYIG